jgi:hypothetical protein
MKPLVQIIKEARRSSIRPDSKRGDEPGVTDKSDNVATVNITDDKNAGLDTKGPDGKMLYSKTKKIVNDVIKPFKEAALDEARAGRPKKNATENDPGSEHIMMQMRKVISLRGQHKVTHVSGEKSDVTPIQAHKAIAHHDNLKTSAEKDSYAKRLHRSAESMHNALSGKAEVHKPKVSLAGKITGTQKEGFVDVTSKSPIPHTTMKNTTRARSSSSNAPASVGSLQRASSDRSQSLQANAEKEANQKKRAAEKEVSDREHNAATRKTAAKPPAVPSPKPMAAPKF